MAKLEDADTAVELIEPWIDKVNTGWLLWMQNDNSLDPIREHPRFVGLMARGARRLAAEKATL
jgi:adenylate cyclase